ncbi:sensor histidine kinase [Thauera sp. ZXT1-4]|uniref:sensor histidine kinase n=1 Tax=Thauera sp. ZXT1-4 TaxID=3460294 RepID=UPI004040B1D7
MSSAAAGSLRLRLLAGTLVWVLLTVVVAGWALGRLFDEHVDRQFRVELRMHLAQLAAQLMIDAEGRPALRTPLSDPRFVRPSSGLYWQVDVLVPESRQAVLRSRSLWDVVLSVPQDLPAAGVFHSHRIEGPDGEPLRLIEQVLYPAEQPEMTLRVIVAANAALVEEPVARFNRLLAIALGVLAGGLVLAALVQVRVGLRPLVRLRDGLAAVRAGRSAALQGSFPAEVQPLVEEFNAVLARNAEVVERARTQAGNLAHAVRTPLTVLANAATSSAHERGDTALARLVAEQVALARTQVDHHLARARAAAAVGATGQRTPLRPVLEGLLRLMAKVHAERGLEIGLSRCDASLAFRGEAQDLQEMLGNLIDNASKWAAHRVEISADEDRGQLRICIDDDGPGLAEAVREAVFARGVRADEHIPGFGLGLSIVRDLAQLYGGEVHLERSPAGGARAVLHLPTPM